MKCAQVKTRLVDFQAGECTPSEEMRIQSHLLYCRGCARELEELKAVGGLLDALEPDREPAGLYHSIMEAVEKEGRIPATRAPASAACRRGTGRPALPGMIRDLAAAAAVTLAVFWLGSGWFGQLASPGEGRVSGAVLSYVRYTGVAVNTFQSSVSAINSDLSSTMDRFSLPKTFKQGSD